MRQWARIHWFQRSGVWLEAEEIQKTTSVVWAQSPVAGLRLQTVRSKRSTVLIRFSQGVWRNQALAGNTVNSRVSQRLRPAVSLLPEAITRSNVFLGVFGVEREHATLQAERLDQIRRGRNLVALLFDHQVAEHDLIGLPQRRHHVRRLAVAESVETAAQGLAVNRDRRQAVRTRRRRNRQCVLAKRSLQSGRIDALNDQPQPGVGGRTAKPQAERFVQPLQMNANELMHLPVGVGPGDHAENGVQQHRGQIEPLAFVATTVWDGAQNLQQRCRHGTTSDSGCRL